MANWTLLVQHGQYKAGSILRDEVGDPIAALIAAGAALVPSVAALQSTAEALRATYETGDPEWAASCALAARTVVQDEGTTVNARPALNFIGAGVSVADDSVNNRLNVTVDVAGISGWTHAAGIVYPTTATDDAAIGVQAMEGTERLRVRNSVALVEALESINGGAGAQVGCTMSTYFNRATGAIDSDVVAMYSHFGHDDAGAKVEYGRQEWVAEDVSAGTEDGSYELSVMVGGALTNVLVVNSSQLITPGDLVVGAAAMAGTERLRVVNTVALVAEFESTNGGAGAQAGGQFATYFNRSTAAVNGDTVSTWSMYGHDDAGPPAAKVEYGRFSCLATTVTSAAEVGSFSLQLMVAGALTEVLTVSGVNPSANTDIATKLYVDGAIASGGWIDSGGFAELFTTADTVVAGAVAMEGAEKFRIVHSTPLVLALETTDAGVVGCTISTHHRSAGPGDGDTIMRWSMFGEADAGAPTKTEMARIDCVADDVSDTTEDATLHHYAILAGALVESFSYNGVGVALPKVGTAAAAASQAASRQLRMSASMWDAAGVAEAVRDFDVYANPSTLGDDETTAFAQLTVDYEGYHLLAVRPSVAAPGAVPGCVLVSDAPDATVPFALLATSAIGVGNGVLTVADGGGTLLTLLGDGDLNLAGGLGAFGVAAPAAQPAHIPDAAGGTEIATINAILVVIENAGLTAAA